MLEITIVVFFMGLLLSVVLINYNKDKDSFSLWSSIRIFTQDFRKVQLMAGEEEVECKIEGLYHSNYSYSYGIYLDLEEDDKYIIFADCNGDNLYNVLDDVLLETVVFENGIKINNFTPKSENTLHVVFKPSLPYIFINETEELAEITLYVEENNTETQKISINKLGRINFE